MWGMTLAATGPAALRLGYLLVRGGQLGWFGWAGMALVPVEWAGALLVDGVLVHLAFAAVSCGIWLAGRVLARSRVPASTDVGTKVSRRGGPGRGSASRVEW